ncbi:hypothetical protein JCM8547_008115 [Rhodosporidiobolus lusitaniae]
MRWIWEDNAIELEHAVWLVHHINQDRRLLPIYILIREHATTLHIAEAVDLARQELLTHHFSSPSANLTPREHRALVLLDWFMDRPSRWRTFFATSGGEVRKGTDGGELWKLWLEEPKLGEERTKEVLDMWEDEMESKEAGGT